MRFVSPALKHIVFPVLSRTGYLRHTIGSGPAVVTYHGVIPPGYSMQDPALDGHLVQPDSLRQQLQLLKARYHVITPDDFLRWIEGGPPLPPRSVLLTCDDALENTLSDMLPILREFGLRCLFFATAASAESSRSTLWYEELYLMLMDAAQPLVLRLPELGVLGSATEAERHSCWWNLVHGLSQFDMNSRNNCIEQIRSQLHLPITWKENAVRRAGFAARFLTLDRTGLKELQDAGMTIGAHSLSHPILAHASPELAWREISESRARLENVLGQTIWAFSYPFGDEAAVTRREMQMAEQAGFRCAFMNTGGGFGATIGRFAVPRVHVTANMALSEFEAHVSGFYRSLRQLGGRKTDVGA